MTDAEKIEALRALALSHKHVVDVEDILRIIEA